MLEDGFSYLRKMKAFVVDDFNMDRQFRLADLKPNAI